MGLRMKDAECSVCGKRWEEVVHTSDKWNPTHCGKPAKQIVLAPAVKFREPHFNRGLGMWVNDAAHLDRELAKRDLWIPTQNDLARAVENGPEDVQHTPDPKIGEIAEKVFSEMHTEGIL